MNKFAQGILFTLAFTTPQGREMTEKAAKVGVKIGDRVLKSKLGIDMKEILAETEKEGVENDTQ